MKECFSYIAEMYITDIPRFHEVIEFIKTTMKKYKIYMVRVDLERKEEMEIEEKNNLNEYNKYVKQVINVFENTKFATVATANRNGIVSASQVTIVNDGLTLYFQTDSSFEKVQNIKENPNIAINFGAIYCKGIAEMIGHPTKNNVFIEKLKIKLPHSYSDYSNLKNEVLIKIKLTEIRIWRFEKINGQKEELIKVMDLQKQTIKNILFANLKNGYESI